MSISLFFAAEDGELQITAETGGYAKIDAAGVDREYIANEVAQAIKHVGGGADSSFLKSSSIDFCDEEGFEIGEAEAIIDAAIEILESEVTA